MPIKLTADQLQDLVGFAIALAFVIYCAVMVGIDRWLGDD